MWSHEYNQVDVDEDETDIDTCRWSPEGLTVIFDCQPASRIVYATCMDIMGKEVASPKKKGRGDQRIEAVKGGTGKGFQHDLY
ncbi:hypothetical protein L6452_08630 [Arctium lappa]|uniref:Uncharacterized protein n=1 Tax=Arctium lappa TaxID=4217 RepID=A0ACB9DI89_ARCLA|nr:hypothetical protein L6452_08630 [Arctium lappa]